MTDIEAEVRKLKPEDGDVIVIRHPGSLLPKARESFASALSTLIEATGKKVQALVLEDGMTVEILRLSQLQDADAVRKLDEVAS